MLFLNEHVGLEINLSKIPHKQSLAEQINIFPELKLYYTNIGRDVVWQPMLVYEGKAWNIDWIQSLDNFILVSSSFMLETRRTVYYTDISLWRASVSMVIGWAYSFSFMRV